MDSFLNCKQKFIIIDKGKWEFLKEKGEYEGVKFEHKSFLDSITKMVESDIGWIRVRIELTECLNCG